MLQLPPTTLPPSFPSQQLGRSLIALSKQVLQFPLERSLRTLRSTNCSTISWFPG
uniref:Uncharacterized protein n=1 Tax=Helianthus annuus TaxID=4232 RepID=A0A251V6M7_HELAN